MPSSRYLLSRLLQAGFSIFAVISFTFVLIRWMPGGPQDYFLAKMMNQNVNADRLALMMEQYANLQPDKPLHEQYFHYMTSTLTGDLGTSIWYQESVMSIIGQALPWTIYLSLVSMMLIFGTGIAFGAVMAYREGSTTDVGSSVFWIVVESFPYYVFAIVMLWLMAYTTGWFPIGGRFGAEVTPGFNLEFIWSVIYHSVLPIASLVITGIGGITLSMRGNSIRVLGEDYLRVARLRGLSEDLISLRYVGRNAILPMYTSMMISIGYLFGGSVILEMLFNYIGIGYYMFEAISAKDYPLMMGTFLFITVGVIAGVTLADLTYGFIDPRASDASTGQSSTNTSLLRLVREIPEFFARKVQLLVAKASSVVTAGGSGSKARTTSTNKAGPGVAATGADGGATADTATTGDLPFRTVSGTTISRRDRYWRWFDTVVLAPLRVLWQDWRARIGGVILFGYVAMAAIAWMSTSDWWVLSEVVIVEPPQPMEGPVLLQPFQDWSVPLGTSDMGRDLLAQTIHATPVMFKMMAGGAVFATFMAVVWGVVAGYAGGAIDRGMMTIADVLMTIPGLPLVIVLATVFEPSNPFLIGIIVVINSWAGFARALRSQVLTIREESYVDASQTMDVSPLRILAIDILPGLMPLVMVNFVTRARNVIVASVGLYFLGILPFTTLNWGVMLKLAYGSGTWYSMSAVHWILVPILTIMLLSLGLILFGQGCDRIFNPRIRARHAKTTPDEAEEVTES
jgi:ABC-type dipeptide/oligopeptide/nickel transport system permease component